MTIIGIATSVWLIGSIVGVIIADSTKENTIAYLRFLDRVLWEISPILARKNITNGVSKINPIQKISLTTKLI